MGSKVMWRQALIHAKKFLWNNRLKILTTGAKTLVKFSNARFRHNLDEEILTSAPAVDVASCF
jgi:hypothetical protein